MLDLRSSGNDDQIKVTSLFLGNVTSLHGTGTTVSGRHGSVLVKVLTRQDKGGGSLLAGDRGDVGGNSLFGVSRTEDIKVRDDTKTGNSLNRLVSRSILTNTDGVVGKNVGHTVELGKGGNTDGRTHVINEDKEGRSRGLEDTVVSNTVKNGTHGMFTDSEVQVLSCVGLVETGTEVSSVVDVVTGRSVKIGRSGDVVRNKLGNFLDNLVTRHTGGFSITAHLRDGSKHVLSRHGDVIYGILKLLGHIGVGLLPCSVSVLPFVVDLSVLLLDTSEEITCSLRNIPLLLRKADRSTGLVNVWDTGLSVGGVGSLSLFHSLSDDGVALNKLGLSVVGGLGSSDGLLNNSKVVSINFVSLKTVSLVTLNDVLRLGVFGHLIKSDFVGVVKDDQVVKLLVSGELGGLSGDSLLEASISSKSEDVVSEDLVLLSVVSGSSHLLRNSETNSVGNSCSKRTSGALNSGGGVLTVGEFRVTRSLGVVLTEVLQFLDGEIESGEVEPGVKEHRSVSSRKDETITVDPLGVLGVVLHLRSVKNGSNFGASKRKTHVSRVGGSNGVHGKTTGFVGSGGKGSLCVNISGSIGHLEWSGTHDTTGGGNGGEAFNTGGKGRGGNSDRRELHLDSGG
mmetsp:Transcript_20994/g.34638  ORF Transcript_20994/g.34638 Transcript_20994/m.34638 type:complete len:622 (+) Transcript_20994:383-2248(+)